MKKLTAIFLLFILLFNLVGYRLVFAYANKSLDKQAEVLFDKNQYDDESLVTIKVPLNIPYLTEQPEFERVDGKINVDGKVFRYVKRKIVNSEMILICEVDNVATKLSKNQNDYFKTLTGLGNNTSKSPNTSNFNFLKLLNVYNNNQQLSCNFFGYKTFHKQYIIHVVSKPLSFPKEPPVQPPDLV